MADGTQDFEQQIPFDPSTIETVDGAMLDYIRDLNLYATTNQGWKKVPVVWASPERAFQSKMGEELRDEQGALILPIISVQRTDVTKDPRKRGTVWADLPDSADDHKGGAIPVASLINQSKTINFANVEAKKATGQINYPRKNKKVVRRSVTIPLPVYVSVSYTITLRTEYQQQMNELVTPFITRPGSVNYILIKKDGHRFEGFIQQKFSQKDNSTDFTSAERSFETTINIEVLAYIIGDNNNQEKPYFVYRENAVEVKIPRERMMLGEVPDHELGHFYGLSPLDVPGSWRPCPSLPFFSKFSGPERMGNLGTGGINVNNFTQVFTEIYIVREVATRGDQVGDGRIFTVNGRIKNNTEIVWLNGAIQMPGPDKDYVQLGTNQIRFNWEKDDAGNNILIDGNPIDVTDVNSVVLVTYVNS